MEKKKMVKGINLILSELLKLNFKVTKRGDFREENIHFYFSIRYSDLKLKLNKIEGLDNMLIILKANEHIHYDDVENPQIRLLPKGAVAFLADTYNVQYYKIVKTKTDYLLRVLPVITICFTIISFVLKEMIFLLNNK